MAITLSEVIESREWNDNSVTFSYQLRGTASDTDARTYLLDNTDNIYENRYRVRPRLRPIHIDTTDADSCIWETEVTYVLPDIKVPDTGDSTFSFNTAGATSHIVQSLKTINIYTDGSTELDHYGAIGVNGDNVDGTDITVPIYEFDETHYIDNTTVTDAYKKTLCRLTGTVNNALFKDFDAGEVLFLGAAGTKRGIGDWEIQFKFAASPNVTSKSLGYDQDGNALITGIAKKGWEYMWIKFGPSQVADDVLFRPKAVYIEQVYKDGDFSELGIT